MPEEDLAEHRADASSNHCQRQHGTLRDSPLSMCGTMLVPAEGGIALSTRVTKHGGIQLYVRRVPDDVAAHTGDMRLP